MIMRKLDFSVRFLFFPFKSQRALSMLVLPLVLLLSAGSYAEVEIGDEAPNFSLPSDKKTMVSLSDSKGKWVVLEWYNNECPYVDKHYDTGNMQKLQKKYTANGVQWYSVVSSAAGKQGYVDANGAKELINRRQAHPSAILLDASGEVGTAYGAKTTPHMFVINPEGKVVYQGAIDDQPSTKRETVTQAKNYLVAALDQGMAKQKIQVTTVKPYGCSVKY